MFDMVALYAVKLVEDHGPRRSIHDCAPLPIADQSRVAMPDIENRDIEDILRLLGVENVGHF
jgi:hypothetical protein